MCRVWKRGTNKAAIQRLFWVVVWSGLALTTVPLEKMHGVRSTDTSSAEDKPREVAAASTTALAAVIARIVALLPCCGHCWSGRHAAVVEQRRNTAAR